MASSKKRPSVDLVSHVESVLTRRVGPGQRLALALSGGVDSVVLLHILLQLRTLLGFDLSAVYVNHGLSSNAGRWGEFCAELCRDRQIPFEAVPVHVSRHVGESLEAAARAARYQVLLSQPADFVVLAHHLDDQAETLLLQLLRGAGLKGLSGMPEARALRPVLLRPLLEASRRVIVDYAQSHGLRWIDDESNENPAFDRNYLRHQVLPVLERRFPAYRETLSRAGRHLAEAAQLLDELAQLDAERAIGAGRLRLDVLRNLGEARAKNLLRHYLARQGVATPPAGRLENMLQQLLSVRDDARVHVRFGGFDIRRYRGQVYVESASGTPTDFVLPWNSEEFLEWPEGGRLLFNRTVGEGISLARLGDADVTIRHRRGGERLRPDCRRPTRTLKHLLQEAGIPPWERPRLPLLFSGEDLVFVPGIGVACAYQAQSGEPALAVQWEFPG
jgi:tRNA(Ile)-lysidine synthase